MTCILVVDDEPTIRELIGDVLRERGYHVQTATNGAQALELMHQQLPQAIVLDLMMPQLDGTGFVELKRLNPRFEPIPILLVTAAFGAEDAAARLQAQAWLAKPFELDELLAMVDRLVGESALPRLPLSPQAEYDPGYERATAPSPHRRDQRRHGIPRPDA